MDRIVALPLGTVGDEYVRRRLGGGNSLSRSVLRSSPGPAAEPLALVPSGTELLRAVRFEEGGLVGQQMAITAFQSRLDDPMAVSGALFIAEDCLLRRGDPALARRRVPLSFFGDEVYYWTNKAAEIPDVLRETRAHFLNCFVTVADGPGEDMSDAGIDELGRATRLVAINAYDDESFVLWRLAV